MNDENLRRHYRACNLCEAICGLEITLDLNDNIVSIRGDEHDPLSRGYICPKAVALQDVYADPNRLKQPVRRTSNGWETIAWNEAFDEVEARLKEIQSRHGKDTVGIFQGNPSVHNSGTLLSAPGFWRALGTKNRFSATSTDQLPHHFVAWLMFGHSLLLPVPDVDRTHYMLIIGGNPLASNGSMMTAPAMNRRLRAIRERGKVVVVDPRRTETAKQADQHFFIKPATDVYLLLALLNVVSSQAQQNNLVNENDVARLRLLVEDYTPEFVAEHTRLSAEDIRRIAKDLITAKNAVVYGRMGVSVQAFGGVCQWAINCLNILTGNFDRAGGAMFATPAFDVLARAKRGAGSFNRWQSNVRGLPEFDGELPSAVLAEEIEHGVIKAMITSAGNPVLSTPNGKALETAFSKLDFMVSIDIYINETTRFANIILPPTTGLETAHYDLVFHLLAVRNTAKFSEPLFAKTENQKHDWEIFQELTSRFKESGNESHTHEEKIDMALRFGFYGKDGLSLAKLKAEPHGVDLGELRPCLPERLLTEEGKINLLPDLIVRDLERVRERLKTKPSDEFDLLLIGRRHLRSNNSWMHNTERLMKGRERCTLLIHPDTAKRKNLTDKSIVRVGSRVGEVETVLEFTEDIMPDVVSLPHGFGHARDGVQLDIAKQYAGASINDLTDNSLIDELTGNAAFSGVPVRIQK